MHNPIVKGFGTKWMVGNIAGEYNSRILIEIIIL
jgi:hypothetical protein